MLFKIFHSFADNSSHAVPHALAISSELVISLRRWSNIVNWHAECETIHMTTEVHCKHSGKGTHPSMAVFLLFYVVPAFIRHTGKSGGELLRGIILSSSLYKY